MKEKVVIIALIVIGMLPFSTEAAFIDPPLFTPASSPLIVIDARNEVTIELNTSGVAIGHELLWTANTTGTNYEESAVTWADGIAYIGSCATHGAGHDKLFAVDTTTGEILWSNDTGPGYVGPVIDGDVVYIGSCTHGNDPTNEYMFAFNRFTGEQLWKVPIYGGIAESIQYDEEKIYFCSGFYETKMYALNKDDGSVSWTYPTSYYVCPNKPMLKDNMVYGAFWDGYDTGRLYKINATTGLSIWNIPLSAGPWDNSITADGNGRIFLAIYYDNTMNAYSENNGQLLWSYPLHAGSLSFNAYHAGQVFIADTSGYVYALDATNGALLWETKVGGTCDISSPTLSGGLLFIGTRDGPNGAFYALNESTGSILWRYAIGASVTAPPSLVDGLMLCGSDGWNMFAFDVGIGGGEWLLHRYDAWNSAYSPVGLSQWQYIQTACSDVQLGLIKCVVKNFYDHETHNITLHLPFPACWYTENGELLKENSDTFTLDSLASGESCTLSITQEPLLKVSITRPDKGIYLTNRRVMSFFFPLVFGAIEIQATIQGANTLSVEQVEFYLDGTLQVVDATPPYSWWWNNRSFGFHTVEVVAYHNNMSVNDELQVCKIF